MKKIILLILLVFSLSMVVSAATFSDMDEVKNQSAVIMLTDLGVLSGYEDGSFRAKNTMSRAEISKVMAVLSTEEMSTSGELSFVDTQDSWAKDYIEYCASQGIISGNNGYFRPEENLTVRELTKMLLVIIGEDEDQFTGEFWAENVENSANSYGLLNGFSGELERYVSRDDAALLINNALQCDIILGYDEDGSPIYNLDDMMNPKSLLETRFGAVLVQGVVEANSVYDLRTDDGGLEQYFIHISGYTKDFMVSDEIATNLDILGHKITLYAIFGTEYNRIVGTVDTYYDEIVLSGTPMSSYLFVLDNNAMFHDEYTNIYVNYQRVTEEKMYALNPAKYTVTAIDNERDKFFDYVFLTEIPVVEEPEVAEESTDELQESTDIEQ